MAPQPSTLHIDRNGAVATVTLNRPEVFNALNAQAFDDLDAAFTALTEDTDIRAIVITGAGEKAFAAGADIRGLVSLDGDTGLAFSQRGQAVFNRIERCGKPVIAAINGVALGGGLELALACTMRLAAETAKLGLPELRLGLIPGYGGTQRLARLIGRPQSLKMILTADPILATEAHRLGLVDEVLQAGDLLLRAQELAASIAAHAPLAVHAAIEAIPADGNEPLEHGLIREAALFARLCGTADKNEGVDAFLSKRKPAWTGL